jgi:hypothetical protein
MDGEAMPLIKENRAGAPPARLVWNTPALWLVGAALCLNGVLLSARQQVAAPPGTLPPIPIQVPNMATEETPPLRYKGALWNSSVCPPAPQGLPGACLPPGDALVVQAYKDTYFGEFASTMHAYFPIRFEGVGSEGDDFHICGSSCGSAFFSASGFDTAAAIKDEPIATYDGPGNFSLVITDVDAAQTFSPEACGFVNGGKGAVKELSLIPHHSACNGTSIHFIKTHIQGSSQGGNGKNGQVLVAWKPPSPQYLGNHGAHRFFVTLFKGDVYKALYPIPLLDNTDNSLAFRGSFDLYSFIQANKKTMTPIAYNYFWVS